MSPAEPPTVRIEHPEVALRQGDSVNITCHIAGEPPATGDWVVPDVGSEPPGVTKASATPRGWGHGREGGFGDTRFWGRRFGDTVFGATGLGMEALGMPVLGLLV